MKARTIKKYSNEVCRGIICKGKYLRRIINALADNPIPTKWGYIHNAPIDDTAKYAVFIDTEEYEDEPGWSEPYIRANKLTNVRDWWDMSSGWYIKI